MVMRWQKSVSIRQDLPWCTHLVIDCESSQEQFFLLPAKLFVHLVTITKWVNECFLNPRVPWSTTLQPKVFYKFLEIYPESIDRSSC